MTRQFERGSVAFSRRDVPAAASALLNIIAAIAVIAMSPATLAQEVGAPAADVIVNFGVLDGPAMRSGAAAASGLLPPPMNAPVSALSPQARRLLGLPPAPPREAVAAPAPDLSPPPRANMAAAPILPVAPPTPVPPRPALDRAAIDTPVAAPTPRDEPAPAVARAQAAELAAKPKPAPAPRAAVPAPTPVIEAVTPPAAVAEAPAARTDIPAPVAAIEPAAGPGPDGVRTAPEAIAVAPVIPSPAQITPVVTQAAANRAPAPQVARLPDGVEENEADLSLQFASDSADINSLAEGVLDELVQIMKQDEGLRVQLLAYAEGTAETASRARRLSLSRALAVRSYLIDRGVRSTRMDVRALGNSVAQGPEDRVDVIVLQR